MQLNKTLFIVSTLLISACSGGPSSTAGATDGKDSSSTAVNAAAGSGSANTGQVDEGQKGRLPAELEAWVGVYYTGDGANRCKMGINADGSGSLSCEDGRQGGYWTVDQAGVVTLIAKDATLAFTRKGENTLAYSGNDQRYTGLEFVRQESSK